VLVFEIATSVTLFQEKLSRGTVRLLKGISFDSTDSKEIIERMFRAVIDQPTPRSFIIGPRVLQQLLDRQTEHIQSTRAFMQSLKFLYMTHYFANALSVVQHIPENETGLQKEQYEAIKHLTSFQRWIEEKLDAGEDIRSFLQDDVGSFHEIRMLVKTSEEAVAKLKNAILLIARVHQFIAGEQQLSISKLYLRGLSGDLLDSPLLRDMLLGIRKMSSDRLAELLDLKELFYVDDKGAIKEALEKLLSSASTTKPFRSEHDEHHETLRTTIVAQKVTLSKHKAALSKGDKQYSEIVKRLDEALNDYFAASLIRVKDLPLHELFLYDTKGPLKDTMTPMPRFAVERALSIPHDYLACECCDVNDDGLLSTQPPIAILYQLYLESGALINIADLWSAFRAILDPEVESEGDEKEELILALFYRGMAELRHLGMVKNSRKKADHVMKLRWKGI
jgi:origin recognition complex subunit 3